MSGNAVRVDEPNYLRDSLAFHIGLLGRQALARTFGDHQLVEMYTDWLADTPAQEAWEATSMPCATLLEFGLSNGGLGTLYAYRRTPEFELTCEHDQFSFAALLSYDAPAQRLDRLFVAHFSGDPAQALRWVHAATIEVGRAAFGCGAPEKAPLN